jgi:hypothetical protein
MHPHGLSSSGSSASTTSTLADHVKSYQLISVIQTNDLTAILPALKAELEYILASSSSSSGSSSGSFHSNASHTSHGGMAKVKRQIPAYGSPLHLAISICSKHVVQQILSELLIPSSIPVPAVAISPPRQSSSSSASDKSQQSNQSHHSQQSHHSNQQNQSHLARLSMIDTPWVNDCNSPDGDTPLHIAVKLRYWDIVEQLLKVPGINDTIKDAQGRTAEDLATGTRLAELFKREFL